MTTDESPRDRAVRECGEWLVHKFTPQRPVHQAFLKWYSANYVNHTLDSAWEYFFYGNPTALRYRPEDRAVQSAEVPGERTVSAPDPERRDDNTAPGQRSLYPGVILY